MTSVRQRVQTRIADVSAGVLQRALADTGLWLDYGAAQLHLRSDSRHLASQVQSVYGKFPIVGAADWADLHVVIEAPKGLRRWVMPQVQFRCDGQHPFAPFPADSPLPMLEWGGNWLIGHRLNHLLLLHSGVVERDGVAMVMPAVPGSGKSTLTAALSLSGWRLLSDEFGAFDPSVNAFRAMLKPVALKNESISVIRGFSRDAVLGPEFPKTRKGTVAHLAPGSDAVDRRQQTAAPGAVILPRWQPGIATELRALSESTIFSSLAFNAFNYQLLGDAGFRAAIYMTRRCLGWELSYSDLDDAIATLDRLWPEVVAHHATFEQADPSAATP